MAMSWQADKVNTSTAYLMHAAFLLLPDNSVRLLLLPLASFPTLCSPLAVFPRTAFALNMFKHEYCWRVFFGLVSNTIHFVPAVAKMAVFPHMWNNSNNTGPLISRRRQTRAHTYRPTRHKCIHRHSSEKNRCVHGSTKTREIFFRSAGACVEPFVCISHLACGLCFSA